MEVISDADYISNQTLLNLEKNPIFADDPPHVKGAKFLKFWHESGRNFSITAEHFGIHRQTTKKIIAEIMTTSVYTQFLEEVKSSLDGIFSDNFKIQLFDRAQVELNEQKRKKDEAEARIKKTDNDPELTGKEKYERKKYWHDQVKFHTQQYHKLLETLIKENAKWVMKDSPKPPSKQEEAVTVSKTRKVEDDLLSDNTIQ